MECKLSQKQEGLSQYGFIINKQADIKHKRQNYLHLDEKELAVVFIP